MPVSQVLDIWHPVCVNIIEIVLNKAYDIHNNVCKVPLFHVNTVMCLHRFAYMLPLSVKAHLPTGCVYAYGQPEEVKQAERSSWTFLSDIMSIVLWKFLNPVSQHWYIVHSANLQQLLNYFCQCFLKLFHISMNSRFIGSPWSLHFPKPELYAFRPSNKVTHIYMLILF